MAVSRCHALPTWLSALLVAASLRVSGARTCTGGPVASCQCLLQCEVFGGVPWQCSAGKDNVAVVDAAVQGALEEEENQCSAMWCIVRCAKNLDCLSSTIKQRCSKLRVDVGTCDVDCDAASQTRAWLLCSLTVVLAMVLGR
eukprot:CAMPEP_0171096590 /NCGR_PEP_ID=MMETSP0766_2-20121228/45235_1 /TAXON_ID=439317 /ORGANISM="Gambierdiscus australes, Strain CAWD 149" /LENGTH=141 /DNA_ID=CAMNT_0011555601 /DNA_START=39 /DNA_END=464 /DNA_ORIENTATION=-